MELEWKNSARERKAKEATPSIQCVSQDIFAKALKLELTISWSNWVFKSYEWGSNPHNSYGSIVDLPVSPTKWGSNPHNPYGSIVDLPAANVHKFQLFLSPQLTSWLAKRAGAHKIHFWERKTENLSLYQRKFGSLASIASRVNSGKIHMEQGIKLSRGKTE